MDGNRILLSPDLLGRTVQIHEVGHVADWWLDQVGGGWSLNPVQTAFRALFGIPAEQPWYDHGVELWADVYATCAIYGPDHADLILGMENNPSTHVKTVVYSFAVARSAYHDGCILIRDAMLAAGASPAPKTPVATVVSARPVATTRTPKQRRKSHTWKRGLGLCLASGYRKLSRAPRRECLRLKVGARRLHVTSRPAE
jgi:hypothetical protein